MRVEKKSDVTAARVEKAADPRKQTEKDKRFCERIERAVLQRAEGYQIPLRKTYKLKRVIYDPETGKKVSEEEVLETGVEEIHVPGDLRAGAYFLNNRAPDRWREHPVEAEEAQPVGGVVILPAVRSDQVIADGETDGETEGS